MSSSPPPRPINGTNFYHKNGELYRYTGPRKQLYPLGLNVPAAFHKVPKSEVNRYKPANTNINGNVGYKKLNYGNKNHYIKVKKHSSGLIWVPNTPVHNRYERKNGKFVKITNHNLGTSSPKRRKYVY